MKKIFSFILLLLCLQSCKDKVKINPDPWILPPNQFFYLITQNGEKLTDTVLNDLKFYYIKNDQKVYNDPNTDNEAASHVLLPSWVEGNAHLDDLGVRLCMEINGFLVENNTWYFEYPNGDIDTLYVENKIISKEEGRNNECYCISPFSMVRFNGNDAVKHPILRSGSGKPVFVLEK